MSSLTSRATASAVDWRRQQDLRNNSQQPLSARPSQSPPVESKQQNTYSVTSYPVQEVEQLGDNTTYQHFNEHDLHTTHLHPDNIQSQSQSNPDYSSHYFSYGNYLTPDQGSENPFTESNYTSPSIDDFLWQESLNTVNGLDEYPDDGTLVNSIFTGVDQGSDLQGISKEISPSSLEPRSTTPRMPTANSTNVTSTQRSMSPTQHQPAGSQSSGMMPNQKIKRAYSYDDYDDNDDVPEERLSRSTSHQQPPNTAGSSMRQVIKPTVMVSVHSRGDSPARTAMPLARSLSKRSQGSRLSDHENVTVVHDGPSADATSSNSRLAPPGHWDDDEEEEEEEEEEEDGDRSGLGPSQRNADVVPSLKDMDKQRELDENRAGVENWLATSESGTPTDEDRNVSGNRVRRERMRSRSTGAPVNSNTSVLYNDKHIPGPGVLIDVDSENDYSDDDSSYESSGQRTPLAPESPPPSIETVDPFKSDKSYFPPVDEDSVAPDEEEPLPRQFYSKKYWQDSARYSNPTFSQDQPGTSNHAIVQYDQAAAKFETASRAATWGTRRRLSDSEIASIVDGSKVRHMSLSSKARDRGNSIINRARTVIRRSSSNVKKTREPANRQSSPPVEVEKTAVLDDDTNQPLASPIQQVQRTFSWGKSKSPPLTSTGGAFLAMTGQLTAVGGGGAGTGVDLSDRPKSPFLSALKRSRSKSDLPKPAKNNPGLSDLFNQHGGPPVPTLASPLQMRSELPAAVQLPKATSNIDDDMDDDNDEEAAVKMELPVQDLKIIPNLDGFRQHAKQLNPRLQTYLIERIAQDQLRRYKKLVKSKIDHTRNVQYKHTCSSREFCVDLGGKPKVLPPRASAKDASIAYAQFKIGNAGDSDGDESAFVEGVVTPALFPSGIPLPPTSHLPAEFECPLCFQVKKFQKPSDWTKHVHEDVQPFSCTFPNCPEPKSFKRKADWVRHENERHRHLEWWKCSIQECSHVCYRKDNFVQHLVREHKMNEPKAKGQKQPGGRARPTARAAQSSGQDGDEFWQLVEHCRHDTPQMPKNEPCKFCGNVCSTWKKLSVHVGKHMEQIAMPVLHLAAKRPVTADTVISPIDPPNGLPAQSSMLDTTVMGANSMDALSPYTVSAHSNYQSSSAGQSPVPMHSVHSQNGSQGQIMYEPGLMQTPMQPMANNIQQFTGGPLPPNFAYQTYEATHSPGYIPMQPQANAYNQQTTQRNIPPSYRTHQVQRSQPMSAGYGGLNVDTMQGSMYGQDHYYPNSAPGSSYMGSFGNAMPHSNGMHSPNHQQAGRLHTPVGGVQPVGNEYMYVPHTNASNGAPYYT